MSNTPEAPAWLEQLDLIKRTVCQGASRDELDLFVYTATRTGLDPLARQIHFVKRGNKGTIQVGIDGLRVIADRTGKYAGSDDPCVSSVKTDQGYPDSITVTVYKMVGGVRCPFSATARWSEYYPGDAQGFQWRKMPHVMLGKCAEALALRKAFPADLSGLYVHEEMEQAGGGDDSQAPASVPLPPTAPKAPAAAHSAERPSQAATSAADAPTTKPVHADLDGRKSTDYRTVLDAWGVSPEDYEGFKAACKAKNVKPSEMVVEAKDAGCRDLQDAYKYLQDGEVPSGPKESESAPEESAAPASSRAEAGTSLASTPSTKPHIDGSIPDGANAFGYVPSRWPLAKMFAEAQTEQQSRMIAGKAKDRMINEDYVEGVRVAVLRAYGLDPAPTKATASLVIDWLINAGEESIDAAHETAEYSASMAGAAS